jgi:hypothetical protein
MSRRTHCTRSIVTLLAAAVVYAETGSADFNVANKLTVAGEEINPRDYKVKWQSHSPETDVVFTLKGKKEEGTGSEVPKSLPGSALLELARKFVKFFQFLPG